MLVAERIDPDSAEEIQIALCPPNPTDRRRVHASKRMGWRSYVGKQQLSLPCAKRKRGSCSQHLRPVLQLGEIELWQHFSLRRRQNAHAPHARFERLVQASSFGSMPPPITDSSTSAAHCLRYPASGITEPSALFHAGHIRQKNQRIGVARHRARRRHLVGVHVVILAIGPSASDERTGMPPSAQMASSQRGSNETDFAHKSQVVALRSFSCARETTRHPRRTNQWRDVRRRDRRDQALVHDARRAPSARHRASPRR